MLSFFFIVSSFKLKATKFYNTLTQYLKTYYGYKIAPDLHRFQTYPAIRLKELYQLSSSKSNLLLPVVFLR